MTQEYVDNLNRIVQEERLNKLKGFEEYLDNSEFDFSEEDKKRILNAKYMNDTFQFVAFSRIIDKVHNGEFKDSREGIDKFDAIYPSLEDKFDLRNLGFAKNFDYLLDSEKIQFDGDIIITDPCYVCKDRDWTDEPAYNSFFRYPNFYDYEDKEEWKADNKAYEDAHNEWKKTHKSDWEICEYGEKMENLGFTSYIVRDTIYGDWSCTTYNQNKKVIGQFCADAGMVAVLLLEEVIKNNPYYKDHIENTHCVTLIKDFHGVVQSKVIKEEWTDKKGKKHIDYSVIIEGKGISQGKTLEFTTRQTGM